MQSAPAVQAPDPVATAKAQADSNKSTAIAQSELNQYDSYNPYGSQTYKQVGTNDDGTPRFSQTTTLSDPEQKIFDVNEGTKLNLANIGQSESAQIGKLLSTPFSVNSAIESKLDSLASARLDPQWAANDAKQSAMLANEGVTPGSEAYNNAMRSYSAAKNDAYNSMYLSGNAQAESESLAERNQPINEISALLSGTQVNNPTFQTGPQSNIAGTDVAGITQNSYLDANQQAQQSVQANNSMIGGLFGLGGTIGSAAIKFSDERLKTDVEKIGELPGSKLPVYSYRYKTGGPEQIGVMAQDVEKKDPGAVETDEATGFKKVNYGRVLAGMVA